MGCPASEGLSFLGSRVSLPTMFLSRRAESLIEATYILCMLFSTQAASSELSQGQSYDHRDGLFHVVSLEKADVAH